MRSKIKSMNGICVIHRVIDLFLQVTLLIPKGNVVARLEVKAHSLVPEASLYIPSTINTMAIRVVEFSNGGYKIKKVFT